MSLSVYLSICLSVCLSSEFEREFPLFSCDLLTPFSISPRCGWSVIMDPIFAVLSEQFTEAEFLQVDSEECRVQQFVLFTNGLLVVSKYMTIVLQKPIEQ